MTSVENAVNAFCAEPYTLDRARRALGAAADNIQTRPNQPANLEDAKRWMSAYYGDARSVMGKLELKEKISMAESAFEQAVQQASAFRFSEAGTQSTLRVLHEPVESDWKATTTFWGEAECWTGGAEGRLRALTAGLDEEHDPAFRRSLDWTIIATVLGPFVNF